MTTTDAWLVPFAGRKYSGATHQNFLWQHDNVYVMDNHRAALWCWLQQMKPQEVIDLLHIDEHTDTLSSRLSEWLEELPSLDGVSIDDYLAYSYDIGSGETKLIRWDNYLSLFLVRYAQQLEECVFATHGVGDKPRWTRLTNVTSEALPACLHASIDRSPRRWMVNVDLDYFFHDRDGRRQLAFAPEYIDQVFSEIAMKLKAGRIACLTLCLTPNEEYTGGWEQAEALCTRACEILDVPFSLPASGAPS